MCPRQLAIDFITTLALKTNFVLVRIFFVAFRYNKVRLMISRQNVGKLSFNVQFNVLMCNFRKHFMFYF